MEATMMGEIGVVLGLYWGCTGVMEYYNCYPERAHNLENNPRVA